MANLETQRPLDELRNIAGRIDRNLDTLGKSATINVLGGLHTGNIGPFIKEHIDKADVVTLELPAEALKEGNNEGGIEDQNKFWNDVLSYAGQEKKEVHAVNTNRAAVNGLRILSDRVRDGQKPFKNGPHVVLSGRYLAAGVPGLKVGDMKYDSPVTSTYLPSELPIRLHDNLNTILNLDDSEKKIPGSIYALILQKPEIGESVRVMAVTGKWALPTEFWLEYQESLTKPYEEEFPVGVDLINSGVDHLLRLRVDKTQSKGMLKALDKKVKQSLREGGTDNLNVLHIGGGIHNPNLVPILESSFDDFNNVEVKDILDDRTVPVTKSLISFFSPLIKAEDGIGATGIFEDQILVDIPRGLSLLKDALVSTTSLKNIWTIQSIMKDYMNKNKADEISTFEPFYMYYLLSLISQEKLESQDLPVPSNTYIPEIENFIYTHVPEVAEEVKKGHKLYEARFENFPVKKKTSHTVRLRLEV